jgi:hypothetical protein
MVAVIVVAYAFFFLLKFATDTPANPTMAERTLDSPGS